MENIIDKIIDIEQRAQEIVRDAKREQSELSQKISGELENMRKKYLLRAEERIEHIRREETRFAEEKISAVKRDHREKLDRTKRLADANISAWIEEAYNYITKPTEML